MTHEASAAPIDPAKLAELQEIFQEEEEILDLFSDFFADVPSRLQDLQRAVFSSQPDQIHAAAHALSGGSGSLGAASVQEAAVKLEEAARQGDLAEANCMLRELEAELTRLHDYLLAVGFLRAGD